MEAGKLRHRVTLQRQVTTQDDNTGEMLTTWQDVAEVWAKVEPLSVREFVQSASGQVQLSARITMRYCAVVDATMRILHRGKIYNIEGLLADKVSGLEYLTLPCSEGVNDGR